MFGYKRAAEGVVAVSAFEPQADARKELFDTSFNAGFNLLIEVIVLTVAFLVFFASFQEKVINAPVADLIYDSRKADLARLTHEFLKNDPTDLPAIFARLPPLPQPPQIPGMPTVPGVPTIPGLPTRPDDGSSGLWVWDLLTASAPWEPRFMHAAAVTRDSDVILSGGSGSFMVGMQNVWRSRNSGSSWQEIAAAPTPLGVRNNHRMAVLPNGNIIVTGGIDYINRNVVADVLRSRDGGATWEVVLEQAPWGGAVGVVRSSHGFVALPDGTLLLVGGSVDMTASGGYDGQVWRSSDEGATWTRLADVAPTISRTGHALVYHPNTNSVLLIGGFGGQGSHNDVWRSSDGGSSWQRIVQNASFSRRSEHSVVAMQDGDLVLVGGVGQSIVFRDVWRSRDGGFSWGLLTRETPWQPRREFAVVAVKNDVLLMGGLLTDETLMNDVWRLRNISPRAEDSLADEVASGSASVELRTRILQRIILSIADPDPNNNAVATHNIWVKRAAIILMSMAILATLIAILVYRTAQPQAKDRVNLPRILALNLIIFVGTFVIQAVFMVFFTLRYIPIKPSLQLETLRDRFNARAEEAIRRNEQPIPTFREGEDIIPTSALVGNGIVMGIVVVIVLVVYLAWKKRAFQKVSLIQAALMGCITVGIVIIGMYFFIQQTYAPRIIERVSDELAKGVVDKTVATLPEKQEFERFRQWINGTFDASIADMQRGTNVRAEINNAKLFGETRNIAGLVILGLVLYIVATQWYRRKVMGAGRKQSWSSFFVAILLVGLVAGTTSVLVEFGFANNILANYISTNPGKLINNTVVNLNASIDKHKEWFLQRKCPVQVSQPCSESSLGNLNQMRYTGEQTYAWFSPAPESAPGFTKTTCEFEKTCDLCCEKGPYLVGLQGRDYVSDRTNLPIGIDQDKMRAGETASAACLTSGDLALPICPPGNWDEERQVCDKWTEAGQEWEFRKDCSTWENYSRNGNEIWRRHIDLDM